MAEVDIRAGQPHYLPFWHYSRFDSVETFNSYVETARACSLYHCTVDVQPGDRLLTLSTCTGTDDNLRLVVMARKVREGGKPAGPEHGGHEHLRPLTAPLYKGQKLCSHTSQRL